MRRQTLSLLIVVVIGALYVFLSSHFRSPPPPPEPIVTPLPASELTNPYSVRISEALYGDNCTGKAVIGALNLPSVNEKYPEMSKDNALEALEKLCNGKTICDLLVSPEALGFDPAIGCKKDLSITYRCFSYDTPHKHKAHAGEKLHIDCSAPKDSSE